MSKAISPLPLAFLMKGMRTVQFALFTDEYLVKEQVAYDFTLDFKFDATLRIALVHLEIVYKQGKKTLCKLDTETAFEIQESSWNQLEKTEVGRIIPKSALAHFALIAVGSARGILHAKTENTALHSLLLPLINVLEMIKEDVVISALKPEGE